MKKIFCFAIVMVSLFHSQGQSEIAHSAFPIPGTANSSFSKASALKDIMDRHTAGGLPGVSMAVFSEDEGWWTGSSGYARLETKTAMHSAHLQYLQSVSKTYMAVAILKLREEGKIDINAPVSLYLPRKYGRYLKKLDKITVKMLLNHTSGVPEYSVNPAFVSYVLLNPNLVFDMEQALKFLKDEDLQFAPGSRHLYCNTNYLLLAMIADAITGDHAAYMNKVIFQKLGLNHTFYRSSPGYLQYVGLVDSYWDVLNTARPANITSLQRANVATLKGDDGIVCTTTDAISFLKGLFEGKLLNSSSMALMQEWVNDDAGKPIYGLGLVHYEAGGLVGYGHSGGGIGAGCILLFVPQKKTYIFIATNVGTLFGGNLAKRADDLKNEVLAAMLF